ncbi:MAG: hypothetical protein AAGC81_19140 [Pseudomonadota bacterium]
MNDQTPDRMAQNSWVPAGSRDPATMPEDLKRLAIDRGIVRAVTELPDTEKAVELGKDHADTEFAIGYGGEVTELERQRQHLAKRLGVEQSELDRIDRDLAGEPRRIPAAQLNGGVGASSESSVEVPPIRWQLRDQVDALVCIVAVIALWVASYFGVHAMFANAQLAILDDFSYLAYLLATLVPVAGLAVKLAGHVFDDAANRARYRKGVVIAGIVAFFLWIPMFGALFEGLSGVFDPYKEANHLLGWAFNVGHIFAEVLIAAGIWAYLGSIQNKYAPSEKAENPERPALERAQVKQEDVVETLSREIGRIEGRLTRLYGIRNSARNLVETAIRQKMNEQPRDGLL